MVSTIFKSGDHTLCDNYMGVLQFLAALESFSHVVLISTSLTLFWIENLSLKIKLASYLAQGLQITSLFLKVPLKNTSEEKRNYACFIDFRKAFDSIWHEDLFLKLRHMGVGDIFYNIIKQMYTQNNLSIRTEEGLTSFSPFKAGVRQGCALSSLLFNLFISDLPEWLDQRKDDDSISLFSKRITHLLYADDLVLLAESPQCMQFRLDSLNEYCTKWRLSINANRSVVIIFSGGNARTNL
jgi:hypothetical protein